MSKYTSDKIVNETYEFLRGEPTKKKKTTRPIPDQIFHYLQVLRLQSLVVYQLSAINNILHFEEWIA